MLLQWCCWSFLILMGFKTIWGASVVLYLPYKSIFFFLSQMQGDVSNMPLYSYVASMWAWPPPKCQFLLQKCQYMWVFVSISIFVFLRSNLFGLLFALCFWFSSPLSAADIVAIGSFIISWNSNDILTNPRAFQIPTDWLFHCFFCRFVFSSSNVHWWV